MSVLLFGSSHRSAPVSVLEKLAIGDSDQPKIIEQILESPLVSEAMVLSTCNRVEVYAVVEAFHGGLTVVGETIAQHAGLSMNELTKYAYVRYSEAAVEHLFAVASGLDSMVVGEQQVLGQVRNAYATAESQQAVGRVLHELSQSALRVGKRVHSETGIDAAGASVVSVALDLADRTLDGLPGRTGVVVGAGSMGSLATAQLVRAGVDKLWVVNRSLDRAQRLAATAREAGVAAQAISLDDLGEALAHADVAVSCTGAVSPVVSLADAHRAVSGGRQLVFCDLGMPRDVDPTVAGLPGVTVVDMERIQREPSARAAATDAGAARRIVADEVARYLTGERMAEVTPTVTALRQRAAEVVEAELLRLEGRLPTLAGTERDEVAKTVRRVVDKLLHAPTVRVKQLASAPGGDSYAEALRELFELNAQAVEAVATAAEIPLTVTELATEAADEPIAETR